MIEEFIVIKILVCLLCCILICVSLVLNFNVLKKHKKGVSNILKGTFNLGGREGGELQSEQVKPGFQILIYI